MSAKVVVSYEYRVSERVVLHAGDTFRASGGPYWKSPTGEKYPLSHKGPFTFLSHHKRRNTEWIEANDKEGSHCVLHVSGRRKRIDGCLVPKPYRVIGKKRPAKKR